MAINRGISVDGQLLPNATGSLYALPSGVTRAVITSASSFANAAAGINLFIVPNGGSAGTSNQMESKLLAANETYTVPEIIGQAIEVGGLLQGNDGGNGGTVANIVLTVTEFTGDS